jgi:CRP-like cAMP-binding protein
VKKSNDELIALTELLAHVPLFATLDERARSSVARQMRRHRFRAGESVVVADDDRPVRFGRMFVILDGTAEVRRDDVTLAELGAQDHFGEMAVLDGGPRSADVIAASDLEVASLAAWNFEVLLKAEPDIALAVIRTLAGRLREADEAAVECAERQS